MKVILLALTLTSLLTACGTDAVDYGNWTLIQADGDAVKEPNATGDHREAYLVRLESLERNKLFSVKCQTISQTRTKSTWDRMPSVQVYMNMSDYNSNTGQLWNNRQVLGTDKLQISAFLKDAEMFTYENIHTFDPTGWQNTWRKAMGHCLTAYNVYVDEWNAKKDRKVERVEIETYPW